MKEIQSILERAKIENIISYLMYGSECINGTTDDYEDKIKNSYERFFDRLEGLFPDAIRNNDDLFYAMVELTGTHEEVFLELGISIGFNLYKDLEVVYQELRNSHGNILTKNDVG